MSQNKDSLKQFLPGDDEVDRLLEDALAEQLSTGGAPAPGAGHIERLDQGSLVKGRVLMVFQDQVVLDIGYKSEGVLALSELPEEPKEGDEIEALVMRLEDQDGQVVLSVREAQRKKALAAIEEADEGAILEGRIVRAVKGGLIVDVGVQAFMPAREADVRYVEDLESLVGLDVRVRILERDPDRERIVVSRRAVLAEDRERIGSETLQRLAVGQRLEGPVTNVADFGAFVDLGGVDGLIHVADLIWGHVKHPSEVVSVGDVVEVVVLSVDREKGRIGLGLKQTGASPWADAETRFAPGQRLTGTVTKLLDFGAVVQIEPGVEGLVHVSEMSWQKRVNKPQEIVKIGDAVEVEVLTCEPDRRRLGLSMRRVEENPWSDLSQRYPFAAIVRGSVSRVEDFGVFVTLEDGIEGLVHVSELTWGKRVEHASELYSEGDAVTALVVGTDEDRQRLSLSIRQTEPDPWWDLGKRFPIGTKAEGTVVELRPFGAFIELEPGLQGLIHVSNMGWRVQRPQDAVKPGDKVRVEVLEADEDERRLGLKLLDEPD